MICNLHADFTKSGDVVTDSVTGLEWQDDATSAMTWQRVSDELINWADKV